MKNQITIKVQDKDIVGFQVALLHRHKVSTNWYSANCPISRAVGREFATLDVAVTNSVHEFGHKFILTLQGMSFDLTEVANEFIRQLDYFKKARAFKFVLSASDHIEG